MKMKKILALLMAMLLAVSVLAACGPAKEEGTSEDTSSTESGTDTSETSGDGEAAADDIMTPYGRYPETIEIHTAKPSSVSPNLAEGDTVDDNPVTRYVKEKINVEVITDWEVESAEFANKLSLMLASDDLPDMFTLKTENYLLYKQLVENGMLADLSEAYDKCADEYVRNCSETFENKNLEAFTEDGKLYAIAGGRYGYEHDQLWLRKDWLDKAGIKEMPKTIEDIENILQTWKDNPPVEDYVGMALHSTNIGAGYGVAYSADPIFNAFGAAPKTWVRDENGEVVYGSVMPQMKEGLAVLADWYKKGLIDSQFATRTAAGATDALFTGGQTGAAFVPWWYSYSLSDFPANNPGAEIEMVNAPLDAEGNFNISWPGPAGAFIMVNNKYEHPEAVVKILNLQFQIGRGFDKEAFKTMQPAIDAGFDWEYMEPCGSVNFEYANCVPEIGLVVNNFINNGEMKGTDELYDSMYSVVNLSNMAKGFADTGSYDPISGWIEYTGRYRASSPELMLADNVKKIEPVFSFTTESMADLKPNLDTLENTTFLKIVMGDLPVDAFDQFVEDWYAQGGQTMTDEVKAEVNE